MKRKGDIVIDPHGNIYCVAEVKWDKPYGVMIPFAEAILLDKSPITDNYIIRFLTTDLTTEKHFKKVTYKEAIRRRKVLGVLYGKAKK